MAIGLSLVAAFHLTGMKRYDLSGLTLYLFSGVVGSVVCTNSLCFEAERVRAALAAGQRVWRILVVQNLAMAILITVAGLPVVAALTWTREANPVVLVDQLVTMIFIWLGVGNVLSVIYPLRHEPVAARLKDGTWKLFLFSFVLSYGVGLTVNLTIYWRLWARETANAQIAGGAWVAFLLVLASALLSWMLLTVFAVACSQQPAVRRKLSREMIAYRQRADSEVPVRHSEGYDQPKNAGAQGGQGRRTGRRRDRAIDRRRCDAHPARNHSTCRSAAGSAREPGERNRTAQRSDRPCRTVHGAG